MLEMLTESDPEINQNKWLFKRQVRILRAFVHKRMEKNSIRKRQSKPVEDLQEVHHLF